MATHSSTPAWRMPWTEEPGGLQSMGMQKSEIQLNDYTAMTTQMDQLRFHSGREKI